MVIIVTGDRKRAASYFSKSNSTGTSKFCQNTLRIFLTQGLQCFPWWILIFGDQPHIHSQVSALQRNVEITASRKWSGKSELIQMNLRILNPQTDLPVKADFPHGSLLRLEDPEMTLPRGHGFSRISDFLTENTLT